MADVAETLSKVHLFAGIHPDGIARIAAICSEESYRLGDIIFKEGEVGDKLYLILDGKVRISREVSGMGEEALAVLGAGAAFGEMSLIDDFPRSADARVHERCRLLVLTKSALEDLLFLDKDLAYEILWNFVKTLSSRLRETNDKMTFLSGDREVLSDPDAIPPGALCGVHEVEATFTCTRCGTFGCEECVFSALLDREVCKACAATGLGEPIPWERRKELGNWNAYWRTVKLAMLQPKRFHRTPTTQASSFGAVAHGVLSSTIGLALSYVVNGLLLALSGGVMALVVPGEGATIGAFLGAYGCMFAGMSPLALLIGPPNALLSMVIAAACSHGFLAIFKRTKGGFEDTLRAVSYANAPYVWSFIPLVGMIGFFWMLTLETVGLRETHRCSTEWALGATLVYRGVLFGGVFLMYAAFFALALMAPTR